MSSPSVVEQAYRSAIALSNSGVALTERQCYRQALETMKDAMAMLGLSFRRGSNNTIGPTTSPGGIGEDRSQLAHIQSCTRNASLRLANPQRCRSCPDGTRTNFRVRALATSDYDKPSSAFVQQCNEETSSVLQSGDTVIYPIRCDDFENECCGDETTCLETKAAIIIHNCALAHWCVSKVTGTPIHTSVAQELLAMSNRIMERLTLRSCQGFFILELRLICLSITVVRSLLLVLREPSQTFMTQSEILELRGYLHTLQNVVHGSWWDESLFIVAAAA